MNILLPQKRLKPLENAWKCLKTPKNVRRRRCGAKFQKRPKKFKRRRCSAILRGVHGRGTAAAAATAAAAPIAAAVAPAAAVVSYIYFSVHLLDVTVTCIEIKTKTQTEMKQRKTPMRGRFAPLAQVPPRSFPFSFKFALNFLQIESLKPCRNPMEISLKGFGF